MAGKHTKAGAGPIGPGQGSACVVTVISDRRHGRSSADYRLRLAGLFPEQKENLVRFLTFRLGTRADAEDVAQEAYLKLKIRDS